VDGLLKIAHFTLETMQFVSLLIRAKILKPFDLLYALFCFGHDDNGVANHGSVKLMRQPSSCQSAATNR
jgi:hypothetical protein